MLNGCLTALAAHELSLEVALSRMRRSSELWLRMPKLRRRASRRGSSRTPHQGNSITSKRTTTATNTRHRTAERIDTQSPTLRSPFIYFGTTCLSRAEQTASRLPKDSEGKHTAAKFQQNISAQGKVARRQYGQREGRQLPGGPARTGTR